MANKDCAKRTFLEGRYDGEKASEAYAETEAGEMLTSEDMASLILGARRFVPHEIGDAVAFWKPSRKSKWA